MNNIREYFKDYKFRDTFDIYKLYDELIVLSNDDLKELYEIDDDINVHELLKFYFQNILKDISQNPKSKCFNRMIQYKKDFTYYPDINEYDVQKNIAKHRELWINRYNKDNTEDNKCDYKLFKLLNHQIYLKNILSPYSCYNSLLLFHGVGVGKTCSAITIAETYNDLYVNNSKNSRVIVLASDNIQVGWRKNIADPKKDDNQCVGNKYIPLDYNSNINIHKKEKQTKKNIKSKYEFFTYRRFASSVKKYIDKNEGIDEIELIKQKYSNRVLIIDEVHNIRSMGDEIQDTMNYLEKVIRYSVNLKLILLTANPMYNKSSEIIWIINMLRLNDNIEPLNTDDYFKNDKFIEDQKDTLREKCLGYISYLRGENPSTFPIRLYPKGKNIISYKNSPNKSLFGNDLHTTQKLKFMKLYGSKMVELQGYIYNEKLKLIFDELKDRAINLDEYDAIEIDNKLRQITNIVYPIVNDSVDDINEFIGEQGIKNNFNYSDNRFSYRKKSLDTYGEFLAINKIGDYSSKIYEILNLIDNSDGIVFIYSNWIHSGIIPICLALEQHGYKNMNGKKYLDCSQNDPMSYDGKRKSECDDFIQGKYAVLSASEQISNNIEDVLKIVNDDENIHGKQIKIIIGSSVASEGLDFKCIRSIHILEPWLNLNKLEQVIGRGVRHCSHKLLSSEHRNTMIYFHVAVNDDYKFKGKKLEVDIKLSNNESIDVYLYRYAERKSIDIGKVENILKQSAIDIYLTKDINILNKSTKKMSLKPALRSEKNRIKNIKDEKYSRVCSFQEKCNYLTLKQNSDALELSNDKTCNDTFRYTLLDNLIDNIKRYISFLYKETLCYSCDEIIDELNLYISINEYIDIIYIALYEMCNDKYIIVSHNNIGYLVNIDNMIIFQPTFNNDKLLSAYYRINSGNNIETDYILENTKNNDNKETKLEITNDDVQNIISRIEKRVYHQDDKSKYFNKTEKQILDMFEISYDIQIGYIYDHLNYLEKKRLLYGLINKLKKHERLSDIENILLRYCQKFFLYFKSDTLEYYYDNNKINIDDLSGFFLFNPNTEEEIYYKIEDKYIEIYSEIDKLNINDMIININKKKLINTNGNWGFVLYSKRYKEKNSMVLKVVKENTKVKKKYKFPPGPGNVVNSLNAEWIKEATLEYIKKLIKEFDKLPKEFTKRIQDIYTKEDYTFLIEIYLRKIEKLYSYDLIWINYKL